MGHFLVNLLSNQNPEKQLYSSSAYQQNYPAIIFFLQNPALYDVLLNQHMHLCTHGDVRKLVRAAMRMNGEEVWPSAVDPT